MKFYTNGDSRNQEKISAKKRLTYLDQSRCTSRPIGISLSFLTIGSRVLMELEDI